jgi:DNA-binding MarR family transcriptional regulator
MSKREQQLNQALEAMHFGFRAMIRKPDERLAELGLARVHHRLLYFIGRNPDCSINELLEILQVSKQYLNRPLKQLIERGYVDYRNDEVDRRIRRLSLSASGAALEEALSGEQRRRFEAIFQQVGADAERHWHEVMALLGRD